MSLLFRVRGEKKLSVVAALDGWVPVPPRQAKSDSWVM